MNTRSLLAACVLAGASWQALACYTVYDVDSRVMYRGDAAPVDMSRPLHETLSQRFPGGQLVFGRAPCAELPASLPSRRIPPAPLLADRRTAQDIGARYDVLSRNIVMVPAAEAGGLAALPSGINVLDSHSVAMGAASAQWAPAKRNGTRPRTHRPAR